MPLCILNHSESEDSIILFEAASRPFAEVDSNSEGDGFCVAGRSVRTVEGPERAKNLEKRPGGPVGLPAGCGRLRSFLFDAPRRTDRVCIQIRQSLGLT